MRFDWSRTAGNRRRTFKSLLPSEHLPGNIYVYAPGQRVLMVIDVIFPGWSPFKELGLAGTVRDFIRAHDDILAVDVETLVAGHVTRLGTREDVEMQRQYVDDIRVSTQTALGVEGARLANGELFAELAAAYGADLVNPWLLFETFLQNVNRRCAVEVIPAWRDHLAAVDVFTFSHCNAMNDFLRID